MVNILCHIRLAGYFRLEIFFSIFQGNSNRVSPWWTNQSSSFNLTYSIAFHSYHTLTKAMNLGEKRLSSELLSCGGSPLTT